MPENKGSSITTASVTTPQSLPGIFGGSMIIAGTSIGAGMFSLPVVSAGMWFGYGVLMLLFSWYCMYSSGLMILETNLHFNLGSSFSTLTKKTLGPWGSIINGLSVTFVLYILTYAYVSGGGSMIKYTLEQLLGIEWPQWKSGLVFGIALAAFVVISTRAVSKISSIMLIIMGTFFIAAIYILMGYVTIPKLIPYGSINYWNYTFIALPFMLTSFGYHGNVPSLVTYYKGNARAVRKTLLYGSLTVLCCYILWLAVSLGVMGRHALPAVIATGGNIGDVVNTLAIAAHNNYLTTVLQVFSYFALASSFLGVTLGLFDYIADCFGFTNTLKGRLKTALFTFAPPILLGVLFPNGFLVAIGFAAIGATIFAVIAPALMVIAARRKFSPSSYTVSGGMPRLLLIILFGLMVIAFQLLNTIGVLPKFH